MEEVRSHVSNDLNLDQSTSYKIGSIFNAKRQLVYTYISAILYSSWC